MKARFTILLVGPSDLFLPSPNCSTVWSVGCAAISVVVSRDSKLIYPTLPAFAEDGRELSCLDKPITESHWRVERRHQRWEGCYSDHWLSLDCGACLHFCRVYKTQCQSSTSMGPVLIRGVSTRSRLAVLQAKAAGGGLSGCFKIFAKLKFLSTKRWCVCTDMLWKND